jgi:mannitol-specific phosphotransferase system IIBC component
LQPHNNQITITGTLKVTVFAVCAMIDTHDYLKTIILVFVFAIVSFVVTLVLKKVMKRFEK